jgi:hypothetical protein
MLKAEAAWLAGIIEGEGWFRRSPGQVYIELRMADADIVHRVYFLAGGTITGPHERHELKVDGTLRKNMWDWRSTGVTNDVAKDIIPWLGYRRRERLLELMDEVGWDTGRLSAIALAYSQV